MWIIADKNDNTGNEWSFRKDTFNIESAVSKFEELESEYKKFDKE